MVSFPRSPPGLSGEVWVFGFILPPHLVWGFVDGVDGLHGSPGLCSVFVLFSYSRRGFAAFLAGAAGSLASPIWRSPPSRWFLALGSFPLAALWWRFRGPPRFFLFGPIGLSAFAAPSW